MKRFLPLVLVVGLSFWVPPQALGADEDSVLLFTSFRQNGQDGLHLMWSRDGYEWTALQNDRPFLKPEVGGKLMRDPHVLQGPDGVFHMVWTTGWTSNGLGYANSKDLIQWSPQQLIQVMDHEPTTRNVWAPELFYLADKKAFVLFWASTIPGRFSETAESGDKGYNHRIYATTTTDFKSFSPTRLFYDDGFNVIDATIVQGDDRFLMFLKDETRNPPKKNLRIATSSKADGPYGPSSMPITGNYWAEGPTAIKLGNTWHVYFDRYVEHRYGLITSADLKSWTDESDKVKFPKDHRHGTVFKVTSKVFQALREL